MRLTDGRWGIDFLRSCTACGKLNRTEECSKHKTGRGENQCIRTHLKNAYAVGGIESSCQQAGRDADVQTKRTSLNRIVRQNHYWIEYGKPGILARNSQGSREDSSPPADKAANRRDRKVLCWHCLLQQVWWAWYVRYPPIIAGGPVIHSLVLILARPHHSLHDWSAARSWYPYGAPHSLQTSQRLYSFSSFSCSTTVRSKTRAIHAHPDLLHPFVYRPINMQHPQAVSFWPPRVTKRQLECVDQWPGTTLYVPESLLCANLRLK